jgi:hypothetical protein
MTAILRRSARPLATLALLAGGAGLTLGFSAGRGAAAGPTADTAHFERAPTPRSPAAWHASRAIPAGPPVPT